MKTKPCCFIGNSQIYNKEEIEAKLKKEIINLIENHGVTEFYNIGKGDFNRICAHCVDKLRNDYLFIKSYLILAFIPQKNNYYPNDSLKIFDGTIYPGIEETPLRYAILKRNKWIINNSDFLISYFDNYFEKDYKTLEYAKKKSHIVIKYIN